MMNNITPLTESLMKCEPNLKSQLLCLPVMIFVFKILICLPVGAISRAYYRSQPFVKKWADLKRKEMQGYLPEAGEWSDEYLFVR